MSDGHQDHNRVASGGGGRRINTGRDVDVEAGLLGYEVFLEYTVEALFVIFRKEYVVGCEFQELPVERPVEGYAGA